VKVKVCKYLYFVVLCDSDSAGTSISSKNIQFLLEPRNSSSKMWFKVKWSPVEINTEARVSSLSAEFDKTMKMPSNFQTKITDIPDDVLLMIFLMLPPKDLISLESSCRRMRNVVLQYNAYKLRLDKIFRSKRLNNYMLLSPQVQTQKTKEEISHYYKLRLYKYIYRSRYVPIHPYDDDYIKLYKTEKKKQELDDLVAENRKHLTHISLKLIL